MRFVRTACHGFHFNFGYTAEEALHASGYWTFAILAIFEVTTLRVKEKLLSLQEGRSGLHRDCDLRRMLRVPEGALKEQLLPAIVSKQAD